MEPPVADLSRGWASSRLSTVATLRLAAAGAAVTLGIASSGDALLLAALLGVAAADGVVFGVGALAALATLLRWGSSSLPALAGAQSVLGPALVTGPETAVVSSVAAGVALVMAGALAARPRLAAALPAGIWAALVVAGPAATTSADFGIRAGAAVAGVAVSLVVMRWVPRRVALPLAGVAALVSVVSAAMA